MPQKYYLMLRVQWLFFAIWKYNLYLHTYATSFPSAVRGCLLGTHAIKTTFSLKSTVFDTCNCFAVTIALRLSFYKSL